ncbi:unnamed protein product [Hyaloperonospora brassicae]|uniref:RxLR effector protein n=1 Tax=Hyaloperonospora brassicae TaxID=162125 RepID=A0AAV0TWE9_HYABA|nr:unnamed protein product [Hyaloperonospora brassicae]
MLMRTTIPACFLLLVLLLVLSTGTGASSAPTVEELTGVSVPKQGQPAQLVTNGERTLMRANKIIDGGPPEERGTMDLGVRLKEMFTNVKTRAKIKAVKRFFKGTRDKVVSTYRKAHNEFLAWWDNVVTTYRSEQAAAAEKKERDMSRELEENYKMSKSMSKRKAV